MTALVAVALPLPLHESFTYTLDPAQRRPEIGTRVRVPFGRRTLVGYVVGYPDSTTLQARQLKGIEAVLDPTPILTPALMELGRWISSYYVCSLGEALRAILPAGAQRRRGPRRGRSVERSASAALLEQAPPASLNTWQRAVLGEVTRSLAAGAFEAFLLHGVTGSGKTEVYMHAIRATLSHGRASIVLIPEIALTPQTADRFRSRLGAEVGILHSGMTLAERHDVLSAAASGDVQVVLGARSAVFAPFRNLGLIVIDEEHENSYKQSEKPRYHARAVGLMRARLEKAVVLLGSATPSLETYQNTIVHKHVRLEMPQRVDARPLARVHVVDMRREENRTRVVSDELLEALVQRVERREQAILLLNRRGHSNYVQCLTCGNLVRCPSCEISLTYHSSGRALRCHYCGHSRGVPDDCPDCGSPCQVFRGIGTQRLEQELASLLPQARVRRMDFDTTSRRGAHRAILEEFARGDVDVLMGTQMVAKGHDFPGVTLVGVLQADAGLSLPDFRAAERTFHLLAQVAGRAGRGKIPGDVYIQTLCPEHYTIALAARQDYPVFFARESDLRRSLGYPPHARLLAITGLGPDRSQLESTMRQVAARLRQPALTPGVQVLGPAPSAIPRLRGRYREQILLKGNMSPESKDRLSRLLAETSKGLPGIDFQVDVDPVSLL